MSQRALSSSAGKLLGCGDFDEQYGQIKQIIRELKSEDTTSLTRELFGDEEHKPDLTKKRIKEVFRFLRRIEREYSSCATPPIPEELEQSIRSRDDSQWLPWELEAIEKIEGWREELQEKRHTARELLYQGLERVRQGQKPL